MTKQTELNFHTSAPVDFLIWFADPDSHPDDSFVSLHPSTPRAKQWCEQHNFQLYLDGMTNDEAQKPWDDLVTVGFRVCGVS